MTPMNELLLLRCLAIGAVILVAGSTAAALNLPIRQKTADHIMTWVACPSLGLLIGVTIVAWFRL